MNFHSKVHREFAYSGARTVTHRWDGRLRLTRVESTGMYEDWTHDLADRRSIASRANGVIDTFAYDEDDRLTHILRSIYYPGQIDPSVLVAAQYGYDAEGGLLPEN